MKSISLTSLAAAIIIAASLAACTSATPGTSQYQPRLDASAVGGAR